LDLLISEQKEPRTPLPLSSPGGNRGTGYAGGRSFHQQMLSFRKC